MGNCVCKNALNKQKSQEKFGTKTDSFHEKNCKQCLQESQTCDWDVKGKAQLRMSIQSTNANSSLNSSFSDQLIQEDIRNTYEIGEIIGHGNLSTVRKANLKDNQSKQFAIKTIKKEKIESELYSLKREISILQGIDHPNIIKVYETYEDDKHYHIVMELCEGGDLFQRLIQIGNYGEKKAAILMYKIFLAVNHLHENEICHRDIKPENFLFQDNSEDSEIKLIDFGFSIRYGNEKMETMIGTPFYLAPEILQANYGPECDI